MSILHKQNVPLATLSTFRMNGIAKEVVCLENETDVSEFFATLSPDKKWFMVGGGSNIVFPDGDCDMCIVQYLARDIKIIEVENNFAHVVVDGGLKWDDFVAYTVQNGLSGIEALSAIPGSTGATPVQNVGAYGCEIKDTLISVRAYDCIEKRFVTLSNAQCTFGYRDSIFKSEAKGRYIITQITFLLSKDTPKIPQYAGVMEYFSKKGITQPTLLQIREAIIEIRSNKLPDPKKIASVGSFFKNPVVPTEKAIQLKNEFPKLAIFPVDEKNTKIGAGSLIDGLGWKGKNFGNISIYEGNALVIVNNGNATQNELMESVSQIISEVQKKYGVILETEPEILNFK
ncbi:MAG: UDP-N-acetylmuramate dehydrogenase [bacterium]